MGVLIVRTGVSVIPTLTANRRGGVVGAFVRDIGLTRSRAVMQLRVHLTGLYTDVGHPASFEVAQPVPYAPNAIPE